MLEETRGRIDYGEEGSGPTILFVPGSWSTRSAWRGVVEELRDRYRIVTTSLLGYGHTDERRTATHPSLESVDHPQRLREPHGVDDPTGAYTSFLY